MKYIQRMRSDNAFNTRLDDFLQHRENGPGWNSASNSISERIMSRWFKQAFHNFHYTITTYYILVLI